MITQEEIINKINELSNRVGMIEHKNLNSLFDIPRVADYLNVSTDAVRDLIKGGELPMVKIGGQWRIAREDLIKWYNNKTKCNA